MQMSLMPRSTEMTQPAEVLSRSPMAGDPMARPLVLNFKDVQIAMPAVHRDRVVQMVCDRYEIHYFQAYRAIADAAPVVRWNCDIASYLHEIMVIHGRTELARVRVDTDCSVGRRGGDGWYAVRLRDEETDLDVRVHHRAEDMFGLDEDLELAFGPNFAINAITGPFKRFADAYYLTEVEPGVRGADLGCEEPVPECGVTG